MQTVTLAISIPASYAAGIITAVGALWLKRRRRQPEEEA